MALFGPLTNRFFPPASPEITIVSRVQGQRQTTSEPCKPFRCLLRLLADRRRTSPTNRELLSECLIPRSSESRRSRWKGALRGPAGLCVCVWGCGVGRWGEGAAELCPEKPGEVPRRLTTPPSPVRRRHLLGRDRRAESVRNCCRPPPAQVPLHQVVLAKRPIHKMPSARAQGDIYIFFSNTCIIYI